MCINRLAMAALVGAISAPAGANLIVNGGFETGNLSGWSSINGPGLDITTDANTGEFALQITGVFDGSSVFQHLDVTPGETYLVSFWIKNLGVGDDLLFVAANGVELLREEPISHPLESWDNVSFEWTPIGGPMQTFIIGGYDNIAAFILDDISVTLVPTPAGAGLLTLLAAAVARRRR